MSVSSIPSLPALRAMPSSAKLYPVQTDATSSAREGFDQFTQMSPAQQMRAMMLGQLGLTEDDLNGMSPEERKKVEDKIKDMIKRQFEAQGQKKTGQIADITA